MAAWHRTIMGVLGAPLLIYLVLPYLCKNEGIYDSKCAHYRKSLYKAAPIRFFKLVWGLPLAGTEGPQSQVVDNLPRYCC
jgi:hypothetical protein